MCRDDQCARENGGSADAGDGSACDEGWGGRCCAAEDGAGFEDDDGAEEGPFHGEDAVELSKGELECCHGEEVAVEQKTRFSHWHCGWLQWK